MATAKKGAKSNKTAHVLNLLTAPGGEKETPAVDAPQAPPAETDAVPPQAEVTEGPSLPLAPPILEVARSNDAQISLQIKDALESELLAEAGLTPAPAAESAPEPAADPIPQPAPEPIPEPETVSEAVPETHVGTHYEQLLAGHLIAYPGRIGAVHFIPVHPFLGKEAIVLVEDRPQGLEIATRIVGILVDAVA